MGYVVGLSEIDRTMRAEVGGKAANLGELARIDGIRVPDGLCVTTAGFEAVRPLELDPWIDRLAGVEPDDLASIRRLSAEARRVLESVVIPASLAAEVAGGLRQLGLDSAYAVRSSATAEDLPGSSFAGQQDSFLNVRGEASIWQHIKQCWASLFTERAVLYRRRNGFDNDTVQMAVLVQRMVPAEAAGIMFTADPITSNRRVVSVEAGFGLGEALVSGLVSPDSYQVRDDQVVRRELRVAVRALPDGGTRPMPIEAEAQERAALTDGQVLRLARLGRRIEAHFGRPQDIEWCLNDDKFFVVQSRPITTLFPIPPNDDGRNHVYISVGHQQMMTDAMKPLGLSFWQLTTPRPMPEAGGRLFVDVAPILGSPATSAAFIAGFTKSDPLIGYALQAILDRGDFVPRLAAVESRPLPSGLARDESAALATDPAVVTKLISDNQASIAGLRREIQTVSGPALFDFILEDLAEL